MKIYLAGNFYSDWREKVVEAVLWIPLEPVTWLVPIPVGEKGAHPDWYTLRDIALLKQADLVFAYITDHSPVNSGTSAEMGYAYALGIPILFVRESTEPRYDFVERMALSTFSSLDEGIETLKFILRR